MNIEQIHGVGHDPAAGGAEAVDSVCELYSLHGAAIHAYVARRVGRDLADDLLADTFRIAIEQWGNYDATIGSARNWLYGIATNLLRRHWRSEQRQRAALQRTAEQRVAFDDSEPDAPASVVDRLDASDEAQRLLAAVARLDADDYDLLVLTAWESMSSKDVADVLGTAPGTVRSRLHRIRRQLDEARRATTTKGDKT